MPNLVSNSNNGSISQTAKVINNNPNIKDVIEALGVKISWEDVKPLIEKEIGNRVSELLAVESIVQFFNNKLKINGHLANIGDFKNIKEILEIYIYKDDAMVRSLMSQIISTNKNTREILDQIKRINELTHSDLELYYIIYTIIMISNGSCDSCEIGYIFKDVTLDALSKTESFEKFKNLNLLAIEPLYAPSGDSSEWNLSGVWNLKSNLVEFLEQDLTEGNKIKNINLLIKVLYTISLIVSFLTAFKLLPIHHDILLNPSFGIFSFFVLILLGCFSSFGYVNLETQFSTKRKLANYLIRYYVSNLAPFTITTLGYAIGKAIKNKDI